jgi:ankyrin repeat protein
LDNKLNATKALLNLGADPNQQNQSGDTMLYLACKQAAVSPAIVGLLIDHKADYQLAGRSGRTPLQALTGGRSLEFKALRGQEARKLAHFVRAGFRPTLPTDVTGQPSLHQLVEVLNHQELLTQIIQAEKFDVNARDPNGWTPLHTAVWHIQLEAGLALLALGADPNLETTRPAKEECRMIRRGTNFGEVCEYRVLAGSRPLDVRPAIGLRGEWHTLFAAIRKAGGTESANLQPAPGFTRSKP